MNFKVEFFKDSFIDAIEAGIYGIFIKKGNIEELLYIGESVFVLTRCTTHLYEIKKGEGYLGFSSKDLGDKEIELVFKLLESNSDSFTRKHNEKELIKQLKPIQQSGVSDRVKSVDKMIEELKYFLENN